MTWFSLPAVSTERPPAFTDMASCTEWLASQPLANAPLMQGVFADQLERLNAWALPARERFKVLETLRKAVFAIENDSVKRYEYRPLPLSPTEQKSLTASCHNWHGMAVGYLICLHACLARDEGLLAHSAKIAHRALTSLRLEQMARYRGGSAVPADFWYQLHAVLASAEQLAVTDIVVSDRLFAETRESTLAAQYANAVLLHLCRPHELSRSQLTATQRWLARWRELAKIQSSIEGAHHSRSVLIDLRSDLPVHTTPPEAVCPRWIALDGVLGKMKSRLKSLRDGQTPEELKLGSSLPAEACIGLLQFLHGCLQTPSSNLLQASEHSREQGVSCTLDGIYQLLGGKPVNREEETHALSNRQIHDQIAIFGRAASARDEQRATTRIEHWQVLGENGSELTLLRRPANPDERLGNRSLIGLVNPGDATNISLAIVRSLCALDDGALYIIARRLPGSPQAHLATGREKTTNRVVRHAAIFLPAAGQIDKPATLFIAAGCMSKLTRLDVAGLPQGLKPDSIIDQGANYERLRCS
ncbi:MAG: hypothetical protein H6943_01455 [Zoogloeaceae bacterium]|nr:hypothetical protein [Zoogloeaceae bacterium]